MAKPPRLRRIGVLDVPVPEASGVAVRRRAGQTRVLVVGDRTAEVAAATYTPAEGIGPWEVLDLAALPDWPLERGTPSQFEGITADGGSQVALLREDPAVVLVADTSRRVLRAVIDLVAPPWSALAGRWDDASSRGEGLVLLRDGRLLVAKEKRPRALVEFGPPGTAPRGLSREDFLAPDEPWQVPLGHVTYHALAVWPLRGAAKQALGDISAVSVGPDRALWLLSDKSEAVARLVLEAGLPRGGGGIDSLDGVYRLPKGVTKPEGIAAVETGRALVVLDTDEPRGNAMLVARPEEQED